MPLDVIKIKNIFLAALEIPGLAERHSYVDVECGTDIELREYVLGMLAAHERHLTPVPEGPTKADPQHQLKPSPLLTPGTIIDGRYKIIELIAEGGMGAVYRANRITDLRMQVAIKVIKPGMGSQQVLARFNIERQALAIMKHENIASVLDAGSTTDGLPYFVMELVKGLSITRFCDENKLSVQERLELFEKVCSAVQHAHQKGIVHRDLKPSNILVALYDDKPVPKVIDFGLAKALHQPLTEDTLHTSFGAFVGTWQYTAPEQAQLNNLDIDTRADIYSLGVILYEFLTGNTPVERQRITNAAYNEVLRMIREEEPPKPSTKIHSSAHLPSIAALRRSEPLQLERMIRGELDWIVMKALEKDRNRRYGTASELGKDVIAFLKGENISAAPPNIRYRAGRFYQKHRRKIWAASLLAAVIIIGAVVSTIGWVTASREQSRADQNAEIIQAVNGFLLNDLLKEADPNVQVKPSQGFVSNITVLNALDRAAIRVGDRFRNNPLIEAEIRFTIGKTYQGLGEFKKALLHFEIAERLLRGQNGGNNPKRIDTLSELGSTSISLSSFKEAEKFLLEAVSTSNNVFGANDRRSLKAKYLLALNYTYTNNNVLARQLFSEILASQKSLLTIFHLDTLYTQRELASLLADDGEALKASKMLEEVLLYLPGQLGNEHPEVIVTSNNYAYCLQGLSKYPEAEKIMLDVVDKSTKLFGINNATTLKYQTQLASVLYDSGKYSDANKIFATIVPIMRVVNGSVANETLAAIQGYGASLIMTKDYPQAEKMLLEAYEGCKLTFGLNSGQAATVLENMVSLYRHSNDKNKMDHYKSMLDKVKEEIKKAGSVVPDASKSKLDLNPNQGETHARRTETGS